MPRCYGRIATWYMLHYLDHKDMKRPTFKDEDYHELQEKYIDWQEDEIKELKESKKLLADAYDLRCTEIKQLKELLFLTHDFIYNDSCADEWSGKTTIEVEERIKQALKK